MTSRLLFVALGVLAACADGASPDLVTDDGRSSPAPEVIPGAAPGASSSDAPGSSAVPPGNGNGSTPVATCAACATSIALDADEMCVVRPTGTIACSGGLLPNMPALTGVKGVSINATLDGSLRFGCAITSSGSLTCWDAKDGGAIASSPANVTAVVAHGALVIRDGVVAWATGVKAGSPLGLFTDVTAVELGSGIDICVVSTTGAPRCFSPSAPVVAAARSVDIQMDFGCFIDVATSFPRCWSPLSGGELALHATPLARVAVSGPGGVTNLEGPGVACGLDSAGAIHCWQAKPPATAFTGATAAMLASPSGTFTAIAGGAHRFCAIDPGGSVVCWGTGAPLL